jgi:hypothetical protein
MPETIEEVKVDARYEKHGSVDIITGVSEKGKKWLQENVHFEAWQKVGEAVAVDPRYAGNIVGAMLRAGLKVGT